MLQYCGGNTTVTISVRTNVVRVVLVVGDVDDDDPSKATISSTNSHTVWGSTKFAVTPIEGIGHTILVGIPNNFDECRLGNCDGVGLHTHAEFREKKNKLAAFPVRLSRTLHCAARTRSNTWRRQSYNRNLLETTASSVYSKSDSASWSRSS